MVMAYRANPTDKQQDVLEQSQFEGGIPVQVEGKQRVVAKALHTAPYRTANRTHTGSAAEGAERNNAGVVMPPSDVPGRFTTPGKA
jgi:hypothetical protein